MIFGFYESKKIGNQQKSVVLKSKSATIAAALFFKQKQN
jgi:hypothetical protein